MRQKKEMRPYQDRIATALYENDEKLCVLRPGGGKTVAALTAIEELIRDHVIRHALVIAPKRVANVVWPDEIEQWAHIAKLRYMLLNGGPVQRAIGLAPWSIEQSDITIVGLDNVQWLTEELASLPGDSPIFDLLVIDEISRLRNPKGKRAQALAKMAPRWKMIWGLSGTLRPSGPEDLFMPARVVTRNSLWGKSYWNWRKANFYPVDFQGYDWKPLPGAEERLNAELAPWIVTVEDGELIQPEPTIIFDRVELPTDARRQYDSMERRLIAQQNEASVVVAGSAAIATGKMAQLANGFIYTEEGHTLRVHEAKREWLEDIIENAIAPTLLIYEFQEDLRLLQELLPKLPYLGAGVSDVKAGENIMLWNRGLLPFMGLHPASGGHGLNLQHGGADMCWLSPTWSPEYWEQTIARLNRSGQKRQVMVRVCVANDTVDELKLDRVHRKMTAQAAFEAYLRRWQTRNKAA
jgi:SNF2-related domain